MKKSVLYFCATSLPSCRSSSVVKSPIGSAYAKGQSTRLLTNKNDNVYTANWSCLVLPDVLESCVLPHTS